jgi:hypothetical protein
MSAFTDFLQMVGDHQVFCCQWFADNDNRVGMNGKIVAFDDRHVVMQGKCSIMHIFRVEDIIEIEYTQVTEIVAPCEKD